MKKICFVISGFGYSGAEIVLERYLNNNNNVNSYFILIYKSKKIYDKLVSIYGKDKVYCLNIKHNKNRLRILPMYDACLVNNKLKEYIQIIKPDILYANNTIEAMLIGKYIDKSDIKSIAHIHDMKQSIKSYIRKRYTEKILKRYDEIITVSEATKKDWDIDRMHVIYNGLDEDYFKSNFKLKNDFKNIGFVGSISKRKGIDKIIEEIDDIIKNGYKLYIAYSNADDIKLLNQLEQKVKLYPKHIFMYNNLSSQEIKEFYDMIDILIVPSRHDPLPTVIIESMARNTLVIGSNVDGIPEILNNEKLIFDIEKKNSILSKINELNYENDDVIEAIIVNLNERCKNIFSDCAKKNKINSLIKIK